MIIRNAYNGTLQEVPDHQLYEVGEPVFDGFGNPVGSIFDDIAKGVGSLVSAPVQAATSLIRPISQVAGGLLNPMNALNPLGAAAGMIQSAAGNFMNPIANATGNFMNAVGQPGYYRPPGTPGYYRPGMPMPFGQRHWPTGWIRPNANLPYTGLGPQRMYMRCAVWPGPAGLVPQNPGTTPLPGMPGAPGSPIFGSHRRHRRHRRR